ncbi:GAF domain-containing protein [Alsobacter sp. SYSU BS001988]
MTARSSADQDSPQQPRRIFGLRLAAVLETVAFLAVALAIDALFGSGKHFLGVSPHPFWIPVLLTSAFYGTNEGLAAAILSSAALLTGNVPQQGFDEDYSAWLLRITSEPALWFVAAVVLGEIRAGQDRVSQALQRRLNDAEAQAEAITEAYEKLARLKSNLEARVAAQGQTVQTMYTASRAIERRGPGEVLMGVSELVRNVLNPGKFSLFLLNGTVLEAAACQGWTADDRYLREIEATNPLFTAVVAQKRCLAVVNREHEGALDGQGMLAGPLVSAETGLVVGMLKIEEIGFAELNPSAVQNFRIVCDWIGAALANAQRNGQRADSIDLDPMRRLLPQPLFDGLRDITGALGKRIGFDVSCIKLSVKLVDPQGDAAAQAQELFSGVADTLLGPSDLRFEHRDGGWDFAILLPGVDREGAAAIAASIEETLGAELNLAGLRAHMHHALDVVYATGRQTHQDGLRRYANRAFAFLDHSGHWAQGERR